MVNWLDRARREILKTHDRGTADTDERNIMAVTAVHQQGESRISAASRRPDVISEESITAVLIDSPIVGPVWFTFDDEWKSGDDIPVFFASELPFLRKMTGAELRRRYEEKLAFGGGWIRDRIEGPTKH